jgi:hypothetical protein
MGLHVPSSVANRKHDGCMRVSALAYSLSGRPTGTVMPANRFLGNPTDRDDNGGLWNRVYCGSRTAVPRETGGNYHRTWNGARAPHFYPNQYGQDLLNKLRDLHERLRTKRYRHQPIRRVHIPKEKKGQTRPIGISATEDKVVQNTRV